MIYRWIGSVTGAAILTFATFLAMPALLRVDSPEAGEEAVRQYAIYYPREEPEPIWQPFVCEHCYYDGNYVDETASIIEETYFVLGLYRRFDNTVRSPSCFSQHQRFLPHEIQLRQSYRLIISIDQSNDVEWRADDPRRNCERYWGCITSVDYRAAETLVACLTETYEFGPGEHRLTVSLSNRQTA